MPGTGGQYHRNIQQFEDWYKQTNDYRGHYDSWSYLKELFIGDNKLNPTNNPFVIITPDSFSNYEYLGELSFGWGIYLEKTKEREESSLVPITGQTKYFFRNILNIDKKNYVRSELNTRLVKKYIKRFLLQHPYTNTLILNLFNVGDAQAFADAFVELTTNERYHNIKFEVRIFTGEESLIEHGFELKKLLNPDNNLKEEAEVFSQPSKNRLFPKLRFSINNIEDYLRNPINYNSHISFLVSPFNSEITLYKPFKGYKADYLNSLLLESNTDVDSDKKIKWNNYVAVENESGNPINNLYNSFQKFTANSLAAGKTESVPATRLTLNNRDQVLLGHLHNYSDWVITFDKKLGPQIFDQPSKDGEIPYLLDYIPGEKISEVSSYLTTKPSAEIMGLISPHFDEFGVNANTEEGKNKIKMILDDLRTVSGSLVMQLNSSKNKAFEAIGMAFAKRVLEKKNYLERSFLVPIDLHQDLFSNADVQSKSRADCLVVSMDVEKRIINITVLEIKCRIHLSDIEREELKSKIKEQIENTIRVLKDHFDPNDFESHDRLDREIKNKELKNLLSFYIDRANRYKYLSDKASDSYIDFLQNMDVHFEIKFNQVGFIFDFSFSEKHKKEAFDNTTTVFNFGESLIDEILDPESDLNTRRLEDAELEKDLEDILTVNSKLKPFIKKVKPKLRPVLSKNNKGDEQVREEDGRKEYKTQKKKPHEASEETQDQQEKERTSKDVSLDDKQNENDEYVIPSYDVLLGKDSSSEQFGILGTSIHKEKVALDLSETNTISLFGVPGAGKSYTIGTTSEMVLKQFSNINKLNSPLASVIFHYNENMDYEPEFTSMIEPNDEKSQLEKLKKVYGANPDSIDDVVILTPEDMVEERQKDYPSIDVQPIAFNSKELNVQDWLFLLEAVGNDSTYIKQLKFMMKKQRKNITIEGLRDSVEASKLLSTSQKTLALQRLQFAEEYINDEFYLKNVLRPGRLVIVDLRDEFIVKDQALGLFVIMLNIFAGVKTYENRHFNKFIVFDEAHKYMDNKDLTSNIVESIRQMRHEGVSIMIASQDPPSLPVEIIELSSMVVMHKFNSPQWLKHVQKSLIQLGSLKPSDLSMLKPGEAFVWASKATKEKITNRAVKIKTRPRVTKHGGSTIKATD